MRVFKDVGMVEQLGSGMSRILKAYNNSIFTFTPNFMIVTFPLATDDAGSVNGSVNTERILSALLKTPEITVAVLSETITPKI
jgi:predicted HTH transcriptional regulator